MAEWIPTDPAPVAVANPALIPPPCTVHYRVPSPADVSMPSFGTPTPVDNTPYQTLVMDAAVAQLRAGFQTASVQQPLTPASSSQDASPIIAQQSPSLLDSGIFDAGGNAGGLSTRVAGLNAAGEPVSQVPPGVQPCFWHSNPSTLEVINTDEMSGALRTFLRHYHYDGPGGLATWNYNLKGYHPLHTLVEALRTSDFPRGHADFLDLGQADRDAWVLELWWEAVTFTRRQYGECTPRTQSPRPPNNTPLMLLSKSRFPVCSTHIVLAMLSFLVVEGVGKPNLVDNRGSNAVMMAAGHGNKPVFLWFAERAMPLPEGGFQWFHHNLDGRNILDVVRNETNPHSGILKLCLDLASRGFMANNASEESNRPGGWSQANQRLRKPRNPVGNRYTSVGW